MTDEQWTRQHVIFERMVRALIDCPVPIIGAVNGAAYGGGCENRRLLRFPLRRGRRALCAYRSDLGIMPGGGGTQTLPRAAYESVAPRN